MNKINQKVEFAANALIIVVAIMLIAFIGHRFLLDSSVEKKQARLSEPTIGKKIGLADINFSTNPKTVLFALQSSCRYCNESFPFYKRLLEETKDKNIRFIAIFPTEVEESRKHLANFGITEIEIKQAPLSAIDASGTPTIILTNDQGEVTNFWIGQLPQDKEVEVIKQVRS